MGKGCPARLNGALKSGQYKHTQHPLRLHRTRHPHCRLAIIDLFRDPAVRAAAHPLMGLWVWWVTCFEAAASATKCKFLSFAQADKATKHSTGRTKEVTLTRVSKTKMGDMEGG